MCSSVLPGTHLYLHTFFLLCNYIQPNCEPVLSLYFQIVYLGLGDTLHLQTDSNQFTGGLYFLTFCVSLTAFDYCVFDDSCLVV